MESGKSLPYTLMTLVTNEGLRTTVLVESMAVPVHLQVGRLLWSLALYGGTVAWLYRLLRTTARYKAQREEEHQEFCQNLGQPHLDGCWECSAIAHIITILVLRGKWGGDMYI